jgi:hypothetical protein
MSWEAQDGWDAFYVFTSFCGYVLGFFSDLMKLVVRTLALRGCCYPHDSQCGCVRLTVTTISISNAYLYLIRFKFVLHPDL